MMRAMEDSSLYRNPTGDFFVGDFQRNPVHYLWMKKITSSMVADQLDCTFLCVGEPKCYSFNMAAYPDFKGLYLCELLATDKYRATNKFHANATFHHYSPSSPCESDPCKNGADCVPDYEMNSYRCHCKLGFFGTHCELEDGMDGWSRTGTAFNNQPTYGDNPTARNRGQPANQQGDLVDWGKRTSTVQYQHQQDMNKGTLPRELLRSPSFHIEGKYISFLIGGGCNVNLDSCRVDY
ncbi:hypothetical protein OS493_024420 [Desmophyllum pertusum]|uniref:EGF-like domain-containing protein n=1 Tax=Desmophyllum pertusum TaxID=174260 RepID=A0A9W9YM00_9CNID|nr:hypothetical protein OS493_024420 [Desmophyllum pertusum]